MVEQLPSPWLPQHAENPTVPLGDEPSGPSAEVAERQFLPGATFGDRYRIIELLGCGGMGEVYRADDLRLGQTVALKFLPRHLADDAASLAQLRNEVRVARKIAHPNVCQVYDIGETDDVLFLSMEYIDGEDLASVLRRLGRPTGEKSAEIARQLCAGLAAAHEIGVLHRDLKPDNVMIDGRGRVRITDFGLAAFSGDPTVTGFAGTPAYMSPELFSGAPASLRSDVYSLGAVLYELFTGRRAFRAGTPSAARRLHETETPRPPSDFVQGIEPSVEEMILRCLKKDPNERPSSALAVAAALPGQDLVAAALAAGQTPAPEIVAAAGGVGALRPAIAWSCLCGILVGVLAIAGMNSRVALHGLAPPAKPTAVLTDRARDIMVRLGYEEPPADAAFRWEVYGGYLEHIEDTDPAPDRWSNLSARRPPVWWLWYRESPVPLIPQNLLDRVGFADPPLTVPGMAGLKLDDQGRLAVLRVVPPQSHDASLPVQPVEWDWLFEAAGLEPGDFTESTSEWSPPFFADTRRAWTGHYPQQPEQAVRVEAAALNGRPVYFNVLESFDHPWTGPAEAGGSQSWVERAAVVFQAVLLVVILVAPVVLARRNLRRSTGDRRGAVRLGVALGLLGLVVRLLSADHTGSLRPEIDSSMVNLGMSCLLGLWACLVYLGVEPHVRRLLPRALISWTRLLMGRPLDPRVGRDVLFGALAGVAVICCQRLEWLVPGWLGFAPRQPYGALADAFVGNLRAWATFLDPGMFSGPFILLLTLTLLLGIFRRRWLAVLCAFVVFAITDGHLTTDGPPVVQLAALIEVIAVWAILLFTVIRFGLLSIVSAFFFFQTLQRWPLILDASVWFSANAFAGIAVLLAVALVATRISMGRGAAGRMLAQGR